jgi:hypothetical protein
MPEADPTKAQLVREADELRAKGTRGADRVIEEREGLKRGTIKQWRNRIKARADAPTVIADAALMAPDELRGEAAQVRQTGRLAQARSDALLAAGKISLAEKAGQLADKAAARALALERAAREADQHAQRLDATRLDPGWAKVTWELVQSLCASLGIGFDRPVEKLVVKILETPLTEGEDGRLLPVVPEPEAESARQAVQQALRAQPYEPETREHKLRRELDAARAAQATATPADMIGPVPAAEFAQIEAEVIEEIMVEEGLMPGPDDGDGDEPTRTNYQPIPVEARAGSENCAVSVAPDRPSEDSPSPVLDATPEPRTEVERIEEEGIPSVRGTRPAPRGVSGTPRFPAFRHPGFGGG